MLLALEYDKSLPLKEDVTESAKAKVKAAKVPKTFPAEALPDLVRLIHMNINNKLFLAKEFIQFWSGKCIEKPIGQQLFLLEFQSY